MTRIARCCIAAFELTLMTAACGTSDVPEAGKDATPLKRTPPPQSEFTPEELEATIDHLVAEINERSIEPMQMDVLLKSLYRFFTPIATGASRAMGELGVTGNVVGPLEQTDDQQRKMELQNRQIEQTVAEGAEGIGISPFGDASTRSARANRGREAPPLPRRRFRPQVSPGAALYSPPHFVHK